MKVSEKDKVSEEKNNAEGHKFELLYSQGEIAQKVKQMGLQLSEDYRDKEPILIGVLKGCILFMADLIREITIPIEIDFITATSYSNGQVQDDEVILAGSPENCLTGRHLLIVEGVVDSGLTIETLISQLESKEPASIEIVTLLDKPVNRKTAVEIKYKGFDAGDSFVIGYGLDESQKYRNLPFIGKVIGS